MIEFLGISKPSQALEAMVDGLLAMKDDPTFRIDMGTYGHSNPDGICYGCAATCTLQQLVGKRFAPEDIRLPSSRAVALGAARMQLELFENAMDWARCGYLHLLKKFFGYPAGKIYARDDRFATGSSWEDRLPAYRALIEELKEAGL